MFIPSSSDDGEFIARIARLLPEEREQINLTRQYHEGRSVHEKLYEIVHCLPDFCFLCVSTKRWDVRFRSRKAAERAARSLPYCVAILFGTLDAVKRNQYVVNSDEFSSALHRRRRPMQCCGFVLMCDEQPVCVSRNNNVRYMHALLAFGTLRAARVCAQFLIDVHIVARSTIEGDLWRAHIYICSFECSNRIALDYASPSLSLWSTANLAKTYLTCLRVVHDDEVGTSTPNTSPCIGIQ